jgi:hypothetical protein
MRELEAYDLRARVYMPSSGRFAQRDPAGSGKRANPYLYAYNNPWSWVDPLGQDASYQIATWLQELADLFLETAMRRSRGQGASSFGTQLHDVLKGVIHSVEFNAPTLPGSIITEVIVDEAGRIFSYGRGPGESVKGMVTADVAILKPGVKAGAGLQGRNAVDVLEAVIDYKTGAAKLAKRQSAFFAKLKVPLLRLFAGGDLASALESELMKAQSIPRPGPAAAVGGKALRGMKKVGGALGRGAKALAPGIAGAFVEYMIEENERRADRIREQTGVGLRPPTKEELEINREQGWEFRNGDWLYSPSWQVRLREIMRFFFTAPDKFVRPPRSSPFS